MNPDEEVSENAVFALVIAGEESDLIYNKFLPRWGEFLGSLQKNVRPCKGCKAIHENVWLIPLSNGLPFLGSLVDWAQSTGIPLRILFLRQEPDWLKYPPQS